jgi:hypothetical protein
MTRNYVRTFCKASFDMDMLGGDVLRLTTAIKSREKAGCCFSSFLGSAVARDPART